MLVLFVRHGLTAWNEAGRIQGQTDIPLSEAGRRQVDGWRLPAVFASARCFTSPLGRAHETAARLGLKGCATDPRLCEMAWGAHEGETLDALRRRHGSTMADEEARGLDFRAPGGESPREVAARLASFLGDAADGAGDIVVVAHKGILRAAIVLAFGWDMLGKSPVAIRDDRAMQYDLSPDGRLTFDRIVDLRAAA